MVGVVMGDDDMADRLRGDAADLCDQLLRQRRRAQRIDHHHALVGDHEAGIRDEVAIGGRAHRGLALHHPDTRCNAPGAQCSVGGVHMGRGDARDEAHAEPWARGKKLALHRWPMRKWQ